MLQFTDQLMNIAWRAFIYKKVEPLRRPAELLMRLPRPHRSIGKYYMGVYLTRIGRDLESLQLLEQAALGAPQCFQARAIGCMGAMAWEAGDLESTQTLQNESIKAATWRSGSDKFARSAGLHSLVMLHAADDDPSSALERFLDILPETAASAEQFPILYYGLLNSIAFELARANRLREAARVLAFVIGAPYRWSGWLDTADHLQAKMRYYGVEAPRLLRFPDGRLLPKPENGGAFSNDAQKAVSEVSSGKRPESLIRGCTLRGKLEAISALLDAGLSDEENDRLLDLLTTLWFETGTWF